MACTHKCNTAELEKEKEDPVSIESRIRCATVHEFGWPRPDLSTRWNHHHPWLEWKGYLLSHPQPLLNTAPLITSQVMVHSELTPFGIDSNSQDVNFEKSWVEWRSTEREWKEYRKCHHFDYCAVHDCGWRWASLLANRCCVVRRKPIPLSLHHKIYLPYVSLQNYKYRH